MHQPTRLGSASWMIAVGDPAGELERLRPVAGDPYRQTLLARPVKPERRAFVGHFAPFTEVADHGRRLLEHREIGGLLAQDATGRVPAADAQVHPPSGKLLEDREDARGDRRLPGRRVRHTGPKPHPVGVLGHEREQHVGLLPEHVAVEEPSVREARGLRASRERDHAIERVVRFQRESEVHEVRNPSEVSRAIARRARFGCG